MVHTVSAMFRDMMRDGSVLVYNGFIYKFDITGGFIEKIPLTPVYMQNLSKVNVISVLSTKDYISLGVAVGDTFKNFEVRGTSADKLLMFLSGEKQYMRVLRRSGLENDIRYNQSLLVYLSSVDVVSILRKAVKVLGCTMEVK